MSIYTTLFLILVLFSIIELVIPISDKTKQAMVNCSFFLMILVSGFRWMTGTDWIYYHDFFVTNTSFSDFTTNNRFEIGYCIYNFLIKSLSNSYSFYLFITACLLFLFNKLFIKKIAPPQFVIFAILLYYSFNVDDLSFVRQNIARAIGLLSLIFVFEKNKKKFIACVLLATSIHVTAFLFIFMYYLINRGISKKTLLGIICTSIILGYMQTASNILYLISGLDNLDLLTSKADTYYNIGDEEHEALGSGANAQITFIYSVIKKAIFLPIFFYFNKKIDSKYYTGILTMTIIGYAMYFFTADFLFIARMSANYTSSEYILYVYIIAYIYTSNKGKNILTYLCIIFMIVYSFYKMEKNLSRFPDLYVPYFSIFENIPPKRKNIL